MSIRIAIHGAAGRMGQRLTALASADSELKLTHALESAGHRRLGEDAGRVAGVGPLEVQLTASLGERDKPDVVIDFSVPEATSAILSACLERGVPLVIATTGLSPETHDLIRRASTTIPVLWAPSMSLTVNLAMKLCQI